MNFIEFLVFILINSIITNDCSAQHNEKVDSCTKASIEAQRANAKLVSAQYYYTRYFDEVVTKSLAHGYHHFDQFGEYSSSDILRATHWLALAGDTMVQEKMIWFLRQVADSSLNYKVDESFPELIDYYLGWASRKELFEICLEFLKPERIYEEDLSDDVIGFNHTRIYDALQSTMTQSDREYYNVQFTNLFTSSIEKNVKNVELDVWTKFYPYLLGEFNSGRIDFKSK